MQRFRDSQTWFIIFSRSLNPRWYSRLLHKDFQHVHLWRATGEGSLAVNQLSHCLAIRHVPDSIESIIEQELAYKPTAVLVHTVHYSSHYKLLHPEIHTCISTVKRILCMRGMFFTPKGLYKELLKAGAEAIKAWTVPHM